jgi:hypothetical protein
MQWILFAAAAAPYRNSITGEIVTVAVCVAFSLIVLWIAYRNFIQGVSTADTVR